MPLSLIAGILVAAASSDVYLDPGTTGAEFCYNPESAFLRQRMAAGDEEFFRPSETFDPQVLADDVALLHRALKENYVGYAELSQTPGFDVTAFFQGWEKRLRSAKGKVRFADEVEGPLLELRRAHTDLHFGSPTLFKAHPELRYSEYQVEVPAGFDVKRCTLPEDPDLSRSTVRVASMLRKDGTTSSLLTLSARGGRAAWELRCGGTTLRLLPRPQTPERPEKEPIYSFRRVQGAAVIRIRDFFGSDAELKELKRIAQDYELHRRHSMLVFDVRGNRGGDDSYLYDWIARAKKGLWRSGPQVALHGPMLPCWKWNKRVVHQLTFKTADSPEAIAEREKLKEGWPHRREESRQVAEDGIVEGKAQHPYSGRIFVLMDAHSVSSGENGPSGLRNAFNARFVGERTGGYLEYANEALFLLPRTGIPWVFATAHNYFDGVVEGVGLPVDDYLEDVGAPVEVLIPLLQKLPPLPRPGAHP